jgi:crotonobetainyl-CoA:carnitine CoA-transferase CaiB-like acyl-CoA transferase
MSLIEQADVYVESYAPGWLERIGLSGEQFMERNPRLIALSQSAFGGEGPKRDQRAYAPLMTAAAGVESTVGYADGPARMSARAVTPTHARRRREYIRPRETIPGWR